jgi:hypothetical protein
MPVSRRDAISCGTVRRVTTTSELTPFHEKWVHKQYGDLLVSTQLDTLSDPLPGTSHSPSLNDDSLAQRVREPEESCGPHGQTRGIKNPKQTFSLFSHAGRTVSREVVTRKLIDLSDASNAEPCGHG